MMKSKLFFGCLLSLTLWIVNIAGFASESAISRVWHLDTNGLHASVKCDNGICDLSLYNQSVLQQTIRLGFNELPNHVVVRHHEKLGTIIGVAKLRISSTDFMSLDAAQRVELYVNGACKYESGSASLFTISGDGSTFFTVEKGGVNSPHLNELAIRRTDSDHVITYPIDETIAGEYESYKRFFFTMDQQHIVEAPGSGLFGEWVFFSTKRNEKKHQLIPDRGLWYDLVFINPEDFILLRIVDQTGVVLGRYAGRVQDLNSMWESKVEDDKPQTLKISSDGKWIGVKSWNIQLYEAISGNQVFSIPVVYEPKKQLSILRSVFDPEIFDSLSNLEDEDLAESIGSVSSIRFEGSAFLIHRQIGLKAVNKCNSLNGLEQKGCREKALSNVTHVIDSMDMRLFELSLPNKLPIHRKDVTYLFAD